MVTYAGVGWSVVSVCFCVSLCCKRKQLTLSTPKVGVIDSALQSIYGAVIISRLFDVWLVCIVGLYKSQ